MLLEYSQYPGKKKLPSNPYQRVKQQKEILPLCQLEPDKYCELEFTSILTPKSHPPTYSYHSP